MNRNIFIALGSNSGEREENLRLAIQNLENQLNVLNISRVYETAPKYVTDQPSFLNMVVEVESHLSPHELLNLLKQIEKEMGRVPTRRYGPRLIDLDLLTYGQLQVQDPPHLQVPHPLMQERGFVLVPLAEIAPNWEHPVLHQTAQILRNALPHSEYTDVRLWGELSETPKSPSLRSHIRHSAHPPQGDPSMTTGPMRRREVLTWSDVDRLVDVLIPQFRHELDAMVIITRGGIVPGGILAEALNIRNILTAAVQFPESTGSQQLFVWPNFLQFPDEHLLESRRVLVVDDVWGSGRTSTAVKDRILAAGGYPECCVLHYNPYRSLFTKTEPDYYGAITDAYVIYPWELDRGGKAERLLYPQIG